MSDAWKASPQDDDVIWYGEVVVGRDVPGGTHTTYQYGYSAELDPDPSGLCPDGWAVLESKRVPVRGGPARFTVDSAPGVAFRLVGFPTVDDGSGGEDIDDSMALVVAVGDNYLRTVDVADLTALDDGDWCGQCGQLGCGHDGRE